MDAADYFFKAPTEAPKVSVQAIIVQDGELLVTVNTDINEEFFLLPGGEQQVGEALPEALVRACRTALGAEVEVGELACIRDYIGANHEFAEWDSEYHQVDVVFWAKLKPGYELNPQLGDDTFQTGVRWLPVRDLKDALLFPAVLKHWLREGIADGDRRPIYLGDVN